MHTLPSSSILRPPHPQISNLSPTKIMGLRFSPMDRAVGVGFEGLGMLVVWGIRGVIPELALPTHSSLLVPAAKHCKLEKTTASQEPPQPRKQCYCRCIRCLWQIGINPYRKYAVYASGVYITSGQFTCRPSKSPTYIPWSPGQNLNPHAILNGTRRPTQKPCTRILTRENNKPMFLRPV